MTSRGLARRGPRAVRAGGRGPCARPSPRFWRPSASRPSRSETSHKSWSWSETCSKTLADVYGCLRMSIPVAVRHGPWRGHPGQDGTRQGAWLSDNIGLLPTQYNYSSEPLWTQVTEREELPDQATRRPARRSHGAEPTSALRTASARVEERVCCCDGDGVRLSPVDWVRDRSVRLRGYAPPGGQAFTGPGAASACAGRVRPGALAAGGGGRKGGYPGPARAPVVHREYGVRAW